ncbi:MAG TPA: peptidoglycan editing factor PgeF, partial [Burkholderiales bacterium]|nr:peptidoglycan editing factor PgeF [Burkholderiales bacterium]
PEAVDANRRLLRDFLPAEPKWLNQVHGKAVVDAATMTHPVEADASFASSPGCVSVVMVADCLPILFAGRTGNVIAAAHAGWRGLAAGVIENTVRALDTAPQDLLAFLGPAIGPSAFEVGNEVRDAFIAVDPAASYAIHPHRPGKWLADLFVLARQRLARAGVLNVYGGGQCTYSEPARFFSHRRDKVSGRMAALIWIGD